eukprot:g17696.t1
MRRANRTEQEVSRGVSRKARRHIIKVRMPERSAGRKPSPTATEVPTNHGDTRNPLGYEKIIISNPLEEGAKERKHEGQGGGDAGTAAVAVKIRKGGFFGVFRRPVGGVDDVVHVPVGQTCVICMEPFQPNEVLGVLLCQHLYHERCINRWLGDHTSCCVCKADMEEMAKAIQKPSRRRRSKARSETRSERSDSFRSESGYGSDQARSTWSSVSAPGAFGSGGRAPELRLSLSTFPPEWNLQSGRDSEERSNCSSRSSSCGTISSINTNDEDHSRGRRSEKKASWAVPFGGGHPVYTATNEAQLSACSFFPGGTVVVQYAERSGVNNTSSAVGFAVDSATPSAVAVATYICEKYSRSPPQVWREGEFTTEEGKDKRRRNELEDSTSRGDESANAALLPGACLPAMTAKPAGDWDPASDSLLPTGKLNGWANSQDDEAWLEDLDKTPSSEIGSHKTCSTQWSEMESQLSGNSYAGEEGSVMSSLPPRRRPISALPTSPRVC